MKPYQIHIPTNVFWGRDIWKEALDALNPLINGNIMIVTTGRSLIRLGYLKELKQQIGKYPPVKSITVFDGVSANPRLSEAREGIRMAKEKNADIIVGFGGGSALDMAKAVAAGAGTNRDIGDYFYGGAEPDKGTLPVIAIPTTAGTGSELSKAAILTDDEKKIKNGIRGRALYPKAAVVDSAFTESVPFSITMETGFDVLAHAAESYLSKASSPYTRMQSEYAIGIVGRMLPRLVQDLEDTKARGEMSYASMIMGINLGNASTCLPHRLQYPLGAVTDTSHGMGLAALYPSWIDYEYPYSPGRVERILHILTGDDVRGKGNCVQAMRRFIKSLHLPVSLKELGIDGAGLADMAGHVSGNIANDPASQEKDIIWKLYRKAWEGT